METAPTEPFLAGVIEGFYGQPWSQAERHRLFDWMSECGLNTYMYAPKDDLKHRALWREVYSEAEAQAVQDLVDRSRANGIRFIYALSPGLDIRYSDDADLGRLKARFEQMLRLGCNHFCLLFDDIPDQLDPADVSRYGSLASAQSQVANRLWEWLADHAPVPGLSFCPTPYCGRMAMRRLGGEDYLQTIGRELHPEVQVFWTGPEIISREIPVAHIEELSAILRRKPLIWDNLHANDYDGRRFYCGPYSGRPLELKSAVAGLLLNPNTEFPLNYVPLRTLGQFVACTGSWNPRATYLDAVREWMPSFSTIHGDVAFEDLVLFTDCYYLPYEEGPEAEDLYAAAKTLLGNNPANWGEAGRSFRQRISRLKSSCVRMTELLDRPLFYALSRRVWELREELDLLEQYVAFKSDPTNAEKAFGSDFHRSGTYRGGLVARLQRLLTQHSDGSLSPADE